MLLWSVLNPPSPPYHDAVEFGLTQQLLNFYRMAFLLFSLLSVLACVALMPLNFFVRVGRWKEARG